MRLPVLVGIIAVAGPWAGQTRKVANKKPTSLRGAWASSIQGVIHLMAKGDCGRLVRSMICADVSDKRPAPMGRRGPVSVHLCLCHPAGRLRQRWAGRRRLSIVRGGAPRRRRSPVIGTD